MSTEHGLSTWEEAFAALPPDMDDELDRNRGNVGLWGAVYLESPVSVERIESPLTDENEKFFGDFAARVFGIRFSDTDERL